MRIKFGKGDPRAGSIAELDEALGQRFVDEGRATKVDATAEAEPVTSAMTTMVRRPLEPAAKQVTKPAKKAAKKAGKK